MKRPARSKPIQCQRCGTCCTKGGPTLHETDKQLLLSGPLEKRFLYTLRAGEVVRHIDDRLVVLENEIIKIKGKEDSWTCFYYKEDVASCGIYEQRPSECRALKCWDHRKLKTVMATRCLRRFDFMTPNDGMVKIIAAHEKRCSFQDLRSFVKRLEGFDPERAVKRIIDLLTYDQAMRSLLIEKMGIAGDEMDLLLGRPLTTTIHTFGLQVEQKGEEFILLPLDKS